jgi:hypothetical protein
LQAGANQVLSSYPPRSPQYKPADVSVVHRTSLCDK